METLISSYQACKRPLLKKHNNMESITDLALKGHFDLLKKEANQKNLNDQPIVLLMKALSYLEKVNNLSELDNEGKSLIQELRQYSVMGTHALKPKPMKRAVGNIKDVGKAQQGNKSA